MAFVETVAEGYQVSVLVEEHKLQEELLHRCISQELQETVLHIAVAILIMKAVAVAVVISAAAMEATMRAAVAVQVTSHY
jgi:hypothetical protein